MAGSYPNVLGSGTDSFWLTYARHTANQTCHSANCLKRSTARQRLLGRVNWIVPSSHRLQATISRSVSDPNLTCASIVAGLKVGDKVKDYPDYYRVLKSQDGGSIALSSFLGKKPVVIFFYPKAGTPGCTKEACKFRDEYEKFVSAGVEVIGISGDAPEQQAGFASEHRLPFTLLSDTGDLVRRGFGIKADMLGVLPGRQTFVIDANGRCVMAFNDQFNPEKHVEEALRVLQEAVTPAT